MESEEKIYYGIRYFYEVLIKIYLNIEQNIENTLRYSLIIEEYQKLLNLTKDSKNEIKDSLFPPTTLSLLLSQCLDNLETLLNEKIDLYLLLERKSQGDFFAITFFKYIKYGKVIKKRRKILEYSLEKLEHEFSLYLDKKEEYNEENKL